MGGAGVRSEIRLAKFISIETGGTPPQNFNFHAYTNFVKRSNRNATTRGSGPEQTPCGKSKIRYFFHMHKKHKKNMKNVPEKN